MAVVKFFVLFLILFIYVYGTYYFSHPHNPTIQQEERQEYRKMVVAEINYSEEVCEISVPLEGLQKFFDDFKLSQSYIDFGRNAIFFRFERTEKEKVIFSGSNRYMIEGTLPEIVIPMLDKEVRIPLPPIQIKQAEEKEYTPPLE